MTIDYMGLNDVTVKIYIYIFPKSCGEHIKHIQAILQCLMDNLLYMKAVKCKFHSFLGYSFGQGIMQMDPGKVSAVMPWPTP